MTTQIEMIDGLTGEKCYKSITPTSSKNARRKARRYGRKTRILSAHASSNKDSSGLKVEWSRLYHQHRIGQNPREILIRQGY